MPLEDDDFDEFGDSDIFDEAALKQIEAAERATKARSTASNSKEAAKKVPIEDDTIDIDDDDWDDEGVMREVLRVEQAQKANELKQFRSSFRQPAPSQSVTRVAGPSRTNAVVPTSSFSRNNSTSKARQLNLFGEEVAVPASQGILLVAKKAHTSAATASQKIRDAYENPNHRFSIERNERKRKEWDREQPLNAKKTRISSSLFDDEDEEDDIDWGGTEADDAFMSIPGPLQPDALPQMKVHIDREEAKRWIYPTNKEMRDYQYNIVQRALFNNVLVALPTGLGKTFIAAVVILNYYRWFPTGKIIFVAPTKPLVAQQQEACHGICGLPWDCAIEMTGGTKASLRGDEWKTKRIFYMTPQTFENDLCTSAVNAEDVVCLVVDEAHRATGNYAYGKIVRWITARNPFFRVLALTATPGNRPEKVQEVIDNLHINLIEIRTEEAVDIRKYVHKKAEDAVSIPLGGLVSEIRDLLVKIMLPLVETFQKNGLMTAQKDPSKLVPYSVSRLMVDGYSKKILTERKLFQQAKELQQLAAMMECLVKYSVQMFYQKLCDIQSGINSSGKKASTNNVRNKWSNNTVIKEIERVYHAAQDEKGKVKHPKIQYLLDSVAAHFASEEEQGRKEDTRVMIFCHFRECVLEIVECLNDVEGIKATLFVGQASSAKGHKGMTQKEQQRIVKAFKEGTFNTMVATSIGEEGLDIGEVDLIINYEAVRNSVRMLQRVGRTGRKRDGRVVILLAEGHEEHSWQHSKDNHKTIQNELINGSHLELFDDVERLVPEDITSEVLLQKVDQPPFEPSMIGGPGKKNVKVAKPKRNSDPHRNIPENGLKGFVNVSDLKKKKKKKAKQSSSNREGDSSAPESSQDFTVSSGEEDEPRRPIKKMQEKEEEVYISDDSQDKALDRGIIIPSLKKGKSGKEVEIALSATPSSQASNGRKRGRLGVGRAPMKMITPQSTRSRGSASSHIEGNLYASSSPIEMVSPPRSSRSKGNKQDALSKDHQDANIMQESMDVFDSSPIKVRKRRGPHPHVLELMKEQARVNRHEVDGDEEEEDEEGEGEDEGNDNNDGDDDLENEERAGGRKPRGPHPLIAKFMAQRGNAGKDEDQDDDEGEDEDGDSEDAATASSANSSNDEMRDETPPDSPVMRKRKQNGPRKVVRLPSSSPAPTSTIMGPPLSTKKTTSTRKKVTVAAENKGTSRKKKMIRGSPTSKKLFAYEADRSTDEEIHGEKDEEDDGQDTEEADSSDREHVGDFAPTQAPRGYNQNAIYMQSLMSQGAVTPFKKPPRGNLNGFQMGINADQVHRSVLDTPSGRGDDSSGSGNEDYERDSFVCSDDEEEVCFDSQETSSAAI